MSEGTLLLNFNIPEHYREFLAYAETFKGKGVVEVSIRRKREQKTLAQAGYLFGVVYPLIAKGLSDSWGEDIDTEACHVICKEFLNFKRTVRRKDTGEAVATITLSFADATKEEASAYIDRVIAFARDQMMIRVPPPEQYREEPKARRAKAVA